MQIELYDADHFIEPSILVEGTCYIYQLYLSLAYANQWHILASIIQPKNNLHPDAIQTRSDLNVERCTELNE